MPRHHETRLLPYAPEALLALIADVESYPDFLPWALAARITARRPIPEGEEIEADLVIGFKVFRERFRSRVQLFPAKGRVETTYLNGPFHHMRSYWQLRPQEGGTEVEFFVDFEMKNALLRTAIGLVFGEAMARIVKAFEARAAAVLPRVTP